MAVLSPTGSGTHDFSSSLYPRRCSYWSSYILNKLWLLFAKWPHCRESFSQDRIRFRETQLQSPSEMSLPAPCPWAQSLQGSTPSPRKPWFWVALSFLALEQSPDSLVSGFSHQVHHCPNGWRCGDRAAGRERRGERSLENGDGKANQGGPREEKQMGTWLCSLCPLPHHTALPAYKSPFATWLISLAHLGFDAPQQMDPN